MPVRDEQMLELLKKVPKDFNMTRIPEEKYVEATPIKQNKETIVTYLTKFFKGKSGWKYVSMSKPGSMFTTARDRNIVGVVIHKTPPTLLSNGKYESESTIFMECIRLRDEYSDFEGLVIDNKRNVYMGSSIASVNGDMDPAFVQEPNKTLIESAPEDVFAPVDADEFELASTEYLKHLAESVSKTNEQFNKLNKFFKDNEAVDQETQDEMDTLEGKLNDIISNPEDVDKSLSQLQDLSKSLAKAVDESVFNMMQTKELVDTIESKDDLGCQSN